MKVIKLLYNIPKAIVYYFNIYYTYYINKIFIIKSIQDFYLLYTQKNKKYFKIMGLQTNHIFIKDNDIFITTNEKRLKKENCNMVV